MFAECLPSRISCAVFSALMPCCSSSPRTFASAGSGVQPRRSASIGLGLTGSRPLSVHHGCCRICGMSHRLLGCAAARSVREWGTARVRRVVGAEIASHLGAEHFAYYVLGVTAEVRRRDVGAGDDLLVEYRGGGVLEGEKPADLSDGGAVGSVVVAVGAVEGG